MGNTWDIIKQSIRGNGKFSIRKNKRIKWDTSTMKHTDVGQLVRAYSVKGR